MTSRVLRPLTPATARRQLIDSPHADAAIGLERTGTVGDRLRRVGGGRDQWGPNESDDAVIAAMHAALDAGINWIDTAEVYGDGVSERLVGRAIDGRRDDVIVPPRWRPSPRAAGSGPIGGSRVPMPRWSDSASSTSICSSCTGPTRAVSPDRGHVGRHERAGRRGRGSMDRCLQLRSGADRTMRGDPPRRFAAACVPHARSAASRADRLVRRAGCGVVSYGPLAFGLLTGAFDRASADAVTGLAQDERGDPPSSAATNLTARSRSSI